MQTSTGVEFIVDISSIIINAIIAFATIMALSYARSSEKRANDRFQRQQDEDGAITRASMKPILLVVTSEYVDSESMSLTNVGPGTAIITEVTFSKGPKKTKNLAEVFSLPNEIVWDTYWNFEQDTYYLMPGQTIILYKISALGILNDPRLRKGEELQIIQDIRTQRKGVTVCFSYEDLLGNKQNEYIRTF